MKYFAVWNPSQMYFYCCIFFVLLNFSHGNEVFEDDMEISEEQMNIMMNFGTRNAWAWSKYYWPNSTLVYKIARGFRKCVCVDIILIYINWTEFILKLHLMFALLKRQCAIYRGKLASNFDALPIPRNHTLPYKELRGAAGHPLDTEDEQQK